MIIKNLNEKTTLATDAKVCTSFLEKLLGLLNKKNSRTLIFYTRFGIHTFGLTQPIDVLVLDRQNRVVKFKRSLKPNSFFFWNPKYSTVIEFPKGTIEKTNTQENDQLSIIMYNSHVKPL